MLDLIKMGDIVCFCTHNQIKIGKVVGVAPSCKEYTIIPIKGNRSYKRKANEMLTARRLLRISENAQYIK